MSTTYLSVDYFPLTVNFFDRDAIELAEAKYGIRVDGAVCKLLCKIFKEGRSEEHTSELQSRE